MRFDNAEHAVAVVFSGVFPALYMGAMDEPSLAKVRKLCPECRSPRVGEKVRRNMAPRGAQPDYRMVFECGSCSAKFHRPYYHRLKTAVGRQSVAKQRNDNSLIDAQFISGVYDLIESQDDCRQCLLRYFYSDNPGEECQAVLFKAIVSYLDREQPAPIRGFLDTVRCLEMIQYLLFLNRERIFNRGKVTKAAVARKVGLDSDALKPAAPFGRRYHAVEDWIKSESSAALDPISSYLSANRLFDKSA